MPRSSKWFFIQVFSLKFYINDQNSVRPKLMIRTVLTV
jgi:hypothetical protein